MVWQNSFATGLCQLLMNRDAQSIHLLHYLCPNGLSLHTFYFAAIIDLQVCSSGGSCRSVQSPAFDACERLPRHPHLRVARPPQFTPTLIILPSSICQTTQCMHQLA